MRIRVTAFDVNESEVTNRKGQSGPDFSFPRFWTSKPSMPSATASSFAQG
ncbi:hypothetical protein VUN82_13135 [Micrococcaceae bacterium Sec5.1]